MPGGSCDLGDCPHGGGELQHRVQAPKTAHVSSILIGDIIVPNIDSFLGIVFYIKEYCLTWFNHQKKRYSCGARKVGEAEVKDSGVGLKC